MKWNADFEIAALIVVFIFIIFYFAKKRLPTRKNKFFAFSLILAGLATLFDLLSAIMDSNYTYYPLSVVHLSNVIFFLTALVLVWSFVVYIFMLAGKYDFLRSPLFFVYSLPMGLIIFLALSTPFTGYLYYIDPVEGYVHGPAFMLQFVVYMYYLVLAGIYVVIYRKRMTKLQFCSEIAFLLVILTGATLQSVFFNWTLISYPGVCLAVTIVYLSLQNPDMHIDKTTGLFNMDAFSELINEFIESDKKFNLIVINIENLNSMKTVYGTEREDEALVKAVEYIHGLSRDNYLFRMSEEDFVLVDFHSIDYKDFSNKFLERFKEPFRAGDVDIPFIGYITYIPYEYYGKDIKKINKFISFINNKLVRSGRSMVINEETVIAIERDTSVERALERAIENNTVQIYLQPIYEPDEGKALAAEVLARLFDEEVGFISPSEFIVKAEENGNVVELGRQIFEKVCIFIHDNDIDRIGIERLCINLSIYQCMREAMADEMVDIAAKHDVPMSRFLFEIVENSGETGDYIIRKNMERLIEAGSDFMLDDYGVGYSNFVNLFRLPYKYVKIDKSLVWTYFESDSNVLPDVMETFRNQSIGIVIQGVESKAMAKRLLMMGCDAMQGYYFLKPMPTRDFIRIMGEKNVEGGYGI